MDKVKLNFMPGLQLNERFYHEVVKPLLAKYFPAVSYSAGLLGSGSDVLGFDTPMSTDHNWGPRLQLFLSAADDETTRPAIRALLGEKLPLTFLGFSVNFSEPDWDDNGTQGMEATGQRPVNHLIEITTVRSFFQRYLNIDPDQEILPLVWLTFSEQHLLEMTAGKIFHDGLEKLHEVRTRLAYYPEDVWRYRLAAQWRRISQEEAFVGRCGDTGDELGSRIIAARLVRDLMKLGFLMEKKYAPYSKWFGTAFAQLACGPRLQPIFNQVLRASSWTERQEPLCEAYLIVAEMHNTLGITAPLEAKISNYFGRPFKVLFADRYAEAIKSTISNETTKNIPANIGGVDQFADCVDLIDNHQLTRQLQHLYE